MSAETIEILIEHKTPNGVLVSDGRVTTWLPISAIENWDDDWGPGEAVMIEIPEAMAVERGLL